MGCPPPRHESSRVAKIAREVFNRADASRITAGFLLLLHASHGALRSEPSVLQAHARGDERLHLALEMELQLVIEVLFHLAAPEE